MKKIYLLAIALLSVVFINAQVIYDWNISDEDFSDLGSISETITINGLTIYSSGNVSVDSNNKKYEEYSYTHRLKTGGASEIDAETGEITSRVLAFDVDGPVSITIRLLSSSGSEDREIGLAFGTVDNQLATLAAPAKVSEDGINVGYGTVNYTGGPTTVYLYSTSGGVNFYHIIVEDYEGDEGVGIQNVDYSPVVSTEYYNLSGVYEGTDYNALVGGVYIQVDTKLNGTKESTKVLKK